MLEEIFEGMSGTVCWVRNNTVKIGLIFLDMNKIDRMVRNAHTKRHLANEKELKAIAMVEAEIEKWN